MAEAKKTNSPVKNKSKTKKNVSQKSNNRSSAKKPSNKNRDAVNEDIILIITMVISILLILSSINLCGPIGKGINYVVFGMIGIIGYVFPFILFFGMAFFLANRDNKKAEKKIAAFTALIFSLTSLIQMISGYNPDVSMLGYFDACGKDAKGGGIIGSILLKILYKSFGNVATIVILAAIIIICFMLITGKTLIAYIRGDAQGSISQKLYDMQEERLNRKNIKDDYEDDEFDDVVEKKRSAKIINLKRIDSNDSESVDEMQNEEPESFVDSLKAISKKGRKSNKKKSESSTGKAVIIEMQEILPEDNDRPIITGSYLSSENDSKAKSIYEDELMKKFGDDNGMYFDDSSNHIKTEETYVNSGKQMIYNDLEDNDNIKDENINDEIKNKDTIENNYIRDIGIDTGIDNSSVDNNYMAESTIAETVMPETIKTSTSTNTNISANTNANTNANANANANANISANANTNTNTNIESIEYSYVPEPEKPYIFPSVDLLSKAPASMKKMTEKELKTTAHKLESTLESFGVKVTVTNVSCGPAVTRYELQPEQGVKVSRITSLTDDIKLNLAASDIRIEAPISGKAAVGIEVPNKEISSVYFREMIEHKDFKNHPSDIAFAVGKDISGQAVVTDIAKMPHLLIAGATGSGKSVCINTLIMSILYKSKPSDVKLIMIDPKVVELSIYNGIPHLLYPVVTDPKQASDMLNWAVMEMTDRYAKFADLGVRDLKGYNSKAEELKDIEENKHYKLPQVVIIVDELADLMMTASKEVETAICRLAQMARAAGMHLIIATQRPSVNVITGVIKANVPSRIAFSVSSAIDSRTIIDGSGAETLLGKGDMLFFPSGIPKPIRVQGAFVSDKEVSLVVDFLKEQNESADYNDKINEWISNAAQQQEANAITANNSSSNDKDDYFNEAGRFIIEKQKASIGMLQRIYKIGFNRAARIMDQLYEAGVVGPEEGTKPRKILMTMEEFEQQL